MSVQHIVVLMFENRSFDHQLGHLSHGGLEPVASERLLASDTDITADPGHRFPEVVAQLTNAGPSLVHDQIRMNVFQANCALCAHPTLAHADVDRLVAQFRLQRMGTRTERIQADVAG